MDYFSIPAKNRKILLHQQKDFPDNLFLPQMNTYLVFNYYPRKFSQLF